MSRGLGKNQLHLLDVMGNEHPEYGYECGYEYTQSDLVKITGATKSSVSRSLQSLYKLGYFQRTKTTYCKREQECFGSYQYVYILVSCLEKHNKLMEEITQQKADDRKLNEDTAALYGMDYETYIFTKAFGKLPPIQHQHGDFYIQLKEMVCSMCKSALAYIDANLTNGDKRKVLRTARSMAHPDKGACSKDAATLGQYIESLV